MSYSYKQQYPIASVEGGKLTELNDLRLPFERQMVRWYCNNYAMKRYQDVYPQDYRQTFPSGTAQKAIFQIAGNANMCISYPESYWTYKIRVFTGLNNSGTELLKPAVTQVYGYASNYCQISGLSSGSQPASGGTVCSLIYRRNANTIFSLIQVKDQPSGQIIDEVQQPGLFAQLALAGQGQEFYSRNYKEAIKYGSTVRSFRDSNYYLPKAGNDMVPSTLIPAIYGDALLESGPLNTILPTGSTIVFPEVQLQQSYEWASSTGATDGGEITVIPFSDYLANNLMCFSQYNKHSIEFTLQTYAGAYTDVISTQASTGNWSYSTNASSFQCYDFKLRLCKYYISNETMSALKEMVTGIGISIPFSKLWWQSTNYPHTQTSMTISITDPRITNLEKVIIAVRRVADCALNANYDNYMLRNMSSVYFSGTTTIGCPTNGSSAASAYSSSSSLAVSTTYNGIWRISGRWAQEQLPVEDWLYIKPYHFDVIKHFANTVFETPEGENTLSKYFYEGIDPSTGIFQNANTEFFIGFDLRTCRGAEKSGISISKSPLNLTIEQITTGGVTNTMDYQLDTYLMDGRELNVKSQGITVL